MASLNIRAALLSVSFLIVALGLWEMATQPPEAQTGMSEYEMLMGGADQESRVPPPSAVIKLAWAELSNPFYDAGANDKGIGIQLAYSVYRVLTGYLAAMAIALPLGFLIGMSPLMYKALNPYIQVLRPISPLAWIPLAILWFGIGETGKIFIIFIATFFPILLNTVSGVKSVDPVLIRAGQVLGCETDQALFRKVILPAAMPTIVVGLRISFGTGWAAIIAAELVAAQVGLGYLIADGMEILRSDLVLVGMVAIGILGVLIDAVFRIVNNRFAWGA